MTDRLAELSAAGVAVWLDDLSRVRLETGSLDKMRREQHVVGVTTNPSIFAKALADAEAYDKQLKDLAAQEVTVAEAVRLLTSYDVRWACDVMKPAYDASGGVDGRVSIEVDPRSAHLTEKTASEAKTLWWLVDRPNLYIKIPATQAGLPAITSTLAAGISVNVTLIFSLERYKAVMDAFLAGLEQAKANGHDLTQIGSVASFFVSRVDSEIDKRLDKIGSDEAKALKGKAAVANAQLAYQAYAEVFSSDRWQALADAGAHPQRPLWASTGTKNPDYKDTIYVEELIAPGTVNTMPESVIKAFEDHGEVRGDTVTGSYAAAQKVMDDIAALGVDYDDVFTVLEDEGVQKFEASWAELVADVEKSLKAAAKGSDNPSDAAQG
jgi:transaldolase